MFKCLRTNLFTLVVTASVFLQLSTVQAACERDDSPADQSIVLAVDISFSVDKQEMEHQMKGYGSALFDEQSRSSLLGCGCTEVTVLFWGTEPAAALETKKIKSEFDLLEIKSFFDQVSVLPLKLIQEKYKTGYITNVGSALQTSASYLLRPGNTAFKKIIIISGDGPHNSEAFSMEKLKSLKKELLYEGVSVYAVPIRVYEDTKDGKIRRLDQKLGRAPKSYYSDEEVEEQLSETPSFYRDYVITRPQHMHVSSSFLDMNRALTQTLKSIQCLLM